MRRERRCLRPGRPSSSSARRALSSMLTTAPPVSQTPSSRCSAPRVQPFAVTEGSQCSITCVAQPWLSPRLVDEVFDGGQGVSKPYNTWISGLPQATSRRLSWARSSSRRYRRPSWRRSASTFTTSCATRTSAHPPTLLRGQLPPGKAACLCGTAGAQIQQVYSRVPHAAGDSAGAAEGCQLLGYLRLRGARQAAAQPPASGACLL